MTSQIETGTPYLLYKDACNKKSNQNNLGTIKSSNLCTEIIEYSNDEETAVCNLASISLPSCVVEKDFNGMEVDIYTKPNCNYCLYSNQLCTSKNIKYNEIDYRELDLDDERLPKHIVFPQIFSINVDQPQDDDEYIGGYTELV